MNVLSKITVMFFFVTALLLQGCASTGSRSTVSADTDNGFWSKPNVFCSGGCKSNNEVAALYWDEFSKQYQVLRSRGERLSPQGRILTPVPGKPSQFQDENGYRIVHQLSCNKENAAVTFFGALLTIGGSQLPKVGARVATVGLTGATQTSMGQARQYNCAELAEELNAGNVVFQQRMNEQYAQAQPQAQETLQSQGFSTEENVQPLDPTLVSVPQSGTTAFCVADASASQAGIDRMAICAKYGLPYGWTTNPTNPTDPQGAMGCGCIQ